MNMSASHEINIFPRAKIRNASDCTASIGSPHPPTDPPIEAFLIAQASSGRAYDTLIYPPIKMRTARIMSMYRERIIGLIVYFFFFESSFSRSLDDFEFLLKSIDHLSEMFSLFIHCCDLFFEISFLEFESMYSNLIFCLEFLDTSLIGFDLLSFFIFDDLFFFAKLFETRDKSDKFSLETRRSSHTSEFFSDGTHGEFIFDD